MITLENIDKYITWKSKWLDKSSIDLFQYISFNMQPDDILIVGKLLFPDIVQVDNCVFLKTNYNREVYESIKVKYGNNHQKIEYEINSIHIYDIFAHSADNVSNRSFNEIAVLLQFSWKIYFKEILPNKRVIVEHIDNQIEYGSILTFYFDEQ